MAIERFEQLEVWQEAHRIVLDVYRTTKSFPAEEKFGLVSQMRRAAVSVPANIAEGFKRRDLSYAVPFDALVDRAERVGRMLTGLINSLRP